MLNNDVFFFSFEVALSGKNVFFDPEKGACFLQKFLTNELISI